MSVFFKGFYKRCKFAVAVKIPGKEEGGLNVMFFEDTSNNLSSLSFIVCGKYQADFTFRFVRPDNTAQDYFTFFFMRPAWSLFPSAWSAPR